MIDNELFKYDIDFSLSKNIKKEILQRYNILPIKKQNLYILAATSDITQDINELIHIFNEPVKLLNVSKESLLFVFKNIELSQELFDLAKRSLLSFELQNGKSLIERFLEILFEFCIKNGVSDIHIETLKNSVIIRLRIDGVLNQFFRYEKELYPQLASVIKLFGNLDISQSRLPVNGSFSRKIKQKSYEFRISTLPSVHGESIVLRILDNENIQKKLEEVGFEGDTLGMIKKVLRLNQGLVLVTGPTGSGKTTTLYSMLNYINDNQRKIITIEDPVEYKLEGIVQVNINQDIDLDYSMVLKNILRQDPDILMIGEIRDCNTLAIALRAALTGHLVIATLHTNSAHETITRLLDLKAQPYLIAATLKMILSQRLLRLLCPKCKVYDKKSGFYINKGCMECNLTGYKNRTVISESLFIDEEISYLISEEKSLKKILNYSRSKGFEFLKDKAKSLLDTGLTSKEEFYAKI